MLYAFYDINSIVQSLICISIVGVINVRIYSAKLIRMVSATNDRCWLRVEVISYHWEGVKQRYDTGRYKNQSYRRHPALAARIMKYDVIRDYS